jgi:hypothetical protein
VLQGGIIDMNIVDEHLPDSILFTFSPSVLKRSAEFPTLQILGSLHPWVSYKEERKLSRHAHPNYVIYFPTHSVDGFEINGTEDESSINFLSKNFFTNTKVIICLHWNDFVGDRRAFFERNGFEVMTLGNPYNQKYFENFYKLASGAQFAIAEGWTSAIAYLIDFGVPCTVIERKLQVTNTSRPQERFSYEHPEYSKELKRVDSLFSLFPPIITQEQIDFVELELGYAYKNCWANNRKAIFQAYFRVLPKWAITKVLKKLGDLSLGK